MRRQIVLLKGQAPDLRNSVRNYERNSYRIGSFSYCYQIAMKIVRVSIAQIAVRFFALLNTDLNPICHLLALLEAHHILHVSRIRVKSHLPSAGIIRSSPYSPR